MRSWFDAGYFTTSLPLWFDANEDGRNAFRRRPMTILELFLQILLLIPMLCLYWRILSHGGG